MSREEENSKSSRIHRFQATMHLAMGLVYILLGGVVLYIKVFGTIELSEGLAYALGGMMILYGGFRIWRGISFFRRKSTFR